MADRVVVPGEADGAGRVLSRRPTADEAAPGCAAGEGLIRRRALLAAPLLALPLSAGAMPAGGYRFRLVREGREIGTHTVRTEPGGVTRTTVALDVKLLSFTVFRMTHDYAERWQGGRLVGFAARTLRNGDEGRLELVATPDGLRGEGPEGAVRLPAEAAPLSWWTPAHLERPLFDTATGKPLTSAPQRSRQGALARWEWPERGMVALYDTAGTWVAFSMRGDDGSTVRYEAG